MLSVTSAWLKTHASHETIKSVMMLLHMSHSKSCLTATKYFDSNFEATQSAASLPIIIEHQVETNHMPARTAVQVQDVYFK